MAEALVSVPEWMESGRWMIWNRWLRVVRRNPGVHKPGWGVHKPRCTGTQPHNAQSVRPN